MIGSPALVLLDEPTSALDPGGRRTVRKLLVELRDEGVGVLLNSHLLSEIELVCDRVVIIDRGRVVTEGRPQDLTAHRWSRDRNLRGCASPAGVAAGGHSADLTADIGGVTGVVVQPGPFGGASATGGAIWLWAVAWSTGILALAAAVFSRRDL